MREAATRHPETRRIWSWILLGSSLLAGWILTEVQGVLLNGLFVAGCLLGAVQPKRFLLLSIVLAVPQAISAILDPYFVTTTLRFIAIELALALALSGGSTGRLARRFTEALLQERRSPSYREVLRSPAVSLALLSAIGWILSIESVWNSFGSGVASLILLTSAFVGGSALPPYWFEVGFAISLPMLFRGIFTDSNLAPFVVLASMLSVLQLVGAALAGRLARSTLSAVRRHWPRSDYLTIL